MWDGSVFAQSSSATWVGRYVGAFASSDPFEISFSPTELIEISASQAVIVVGTGSGALPAGIELFGMGSYQGTLSVSFGTGAASIVPFTFTPSGDAPAWKSFEYPDGVGGLNAPVLGSPLSILPMYALSLSPDPQSPTDAELSFAAVDYHVAAEFYVESNSYSDQFATPTRLASIVSYDENGVQVARIDLVEFERSVAPVGGKWTYTSLITKPIVLVDVTFTTAPAGSVTTLIPAISGGYVFCGP